MAIATSVAYKGVTNGIQYQIFLNRRTEELSFARKEMLRIEARSPSPSNSSSIKVSYNNFYENAFLAADDSLRLASLIIENALEREALLQSSFRTVFSTLNLLLDKGHEAETNLPGLTGPSALRSIRQLDELAASLGLREEFRNVTISELGKLNARSYMEKKHEPIFDLPVTVSPQAVLTLVAALELDSWNPKEAVSIKEILPPLRS